MPLDLPTFATDFELSSLASLPSFRKYCPMTLSSVRFCYAVWRLSAVHGRAIDHQIYAGSRNVSLAFSFSSSSSSSFSSSSSSSSFSSSFLSRLEACLLRIVARLSLYRAHGAINNLLQRFDNRFKMPVQCHVLFESTSL